MNQNFVEEIQSAKDSAELKKIYDKIIASGFINYKFDAEEFEKNIAEFYELTFDNQKKLLIELLDKNLLYVNYYDIDDEEYKISDADKKFTRSFYGED